MNPLNETVANELKQHGIEFIHFVDISGLAERQNRGFAFAVLFGVKCSPEYLKRVSDNPNYVPDMVTRNYFDDDEHYAYEMGMYRISDLLAEFIEKSGYKAYSLSDTNQIATSNFDGMFGKTMLPLKTLATLAGLGWIGKNNLLVNKEFGCSQTWGAVLTDAPLHTVLNNPPAVQCGNCRICLEICEPVALKGAIWQSDMKREDMIDVNKCTTCLKCMVHCPWTQRFMKKKSSIINKTEILSKICYTELVYERINKKLNTKLSKAQIERMLLTIIKETKEEFFQKAGKNIYVTNHENNIRITINSYTFRVITVDRITKEQSKVRDNTIKLKVK